MKLGVNKVKKVTQPEFWKNLNLRIKGDWVSKIWVFQHFVGNRSLKASMFCMTLEGNRAHHLILVYLGKILIWHFEKWLLGAQITFRGFSYKFANIKLWWQSIGKLEFEPSSIMVGENLKITCLKCLQMFLIVKNQNFLPLKQKSENPNSSLKPLLPRHFEKWLPPQTEPFKKYWFLPKKFWEKWHFEGLGDLRLFVSKKVSCQCIIVERID